MVTGRVEAVPAGGYGGCGRGSRGRGETCRLCAPEWGPTLLASSRDHPASFTGDLTAQYRQATRQGEWENSREGTRGRDDILVHWDHPHVASAGMEHTKSLRRDPSSDKEDPELFGYPNFVFLVSSNFGQIYIKLTLKLKKNNLEFIMLVSSRQKWLLMKHGMLL